MSHGFSVRRGARNLRGHDRRAATAGRCGSLIVAFLDKQYISSSHTYPLIKIKAVHIRFEYIAI